MSLTPLWCNSMQRVCTLQPQTLYSPEFPIQS